MRAGATERALRWPGQPDRLPDADRQPRGPHPARAPGARARPTSSPARTPGAPGRLYERLEIDAPAARLLPRAATRPSAPASSRQQIERGARVALITDAGTPGDLRSRLPADPRLHRARRSTSRCCPGPSAVITALVASGPAGRPLALRGLPAAARRASSSACCARPETVVAFESPRRLPASLAALAALAPDRQAAVCRELTKLHEEVARGHARRARAPLSRRGQAARSSS